MLRKAARKETAMTTFNHETIIVGAGRAGMNKLMG